MCCGAMSVIAIYNFYRCSQITFAFFRTNFKIDRLLTYMTLYADTLASHSYRFKRLMLAYSNSEIEQTLRNARLLFEKLDKALDSPNETTEKYRLRIENLVEIYRQQGEIEDLKAEIEGLYEELQASI